MKPDPKFGWHVLWLVPLLMVGAAYGKVRRFFCGLKQKKIKASWSTETKRIRTLAGLDD